MSQAALLRRLRNAQTGCFPGLAPRYPASPHEEVEAQQDYNRIQLASELLKIAAEASLPSALPGIADFALEAAAKIYPELPEEGEPFLNNVMGLGAARDGAQAVLGRQE